MDFSGGSDGKASVYNGRPGFDPWIGKIRWKRKWQSTPVLLSGKSHGQRSLIGYSPWGCKELDTTERLHFHSHPYMTTGKTIALTRWTFVGKVMSLLFNMLSRLVIAFLPRSKCLLNSWLQSPSAVILEPKQIKSVTISIVSPSVSHEVMGPDAMIIVFWMLSVKPAFSLLFHFHQEALLFLFTFCHKGGIISISEFIDISPGNLYSSLCFIQPGISYDVLFCM